MMMATVMIQKRLMKFRFDFIFRLSEPNLVTVTLTTNQELYYIYSQLTQCEGELLVGCTLSADGDQAEYQCSQGGVGSRFILLQTGQFPSS